MSSVQQMPSLSMEAALDRKQQWLMSAAVLTDLLVTNAKRPVF